MGIVRRDVSNHSTAELEGVARTCTTLVHEDYGNANLPTLQMKAMRPSVGWLGDNNLQNDGRRTINSVRQSKSVVSSMTPYE